MKSSQMLLLAGGAVVVLAGIMFLDDTPPDSFVPVKRPTQGRLLIKGKRVLKYCPQPSALTYSNLEWTAPGGWHSVDKPLTKKAGSFTKAQWQGVNLGEVICQYSSAGVSGFPIELHRLIGKVVFEPIEEIWKKTHAGTKTCFSRKAYNCPFYQRQREDQQPFPEMYKNIFQFDDKAKKTNPSKS